jgi:O-acetyl-ADP-ribose deacetylase (regulator of RNase III)
MASKLVDLQLDDAELLSVVDKGASGDDTVAPRVVLIKRRSPRAAEEVKKIMTPEERAAAMEALRAKLDEEGQTMLMALLEPPKEDAPKADDMPAEDVPKADGMPAEDEKVAGCDLEKVRKVAPDVVKRLEHAESTSAELAKRLATIEDERATEVFKRMAVEKYKAIPGETAATADLLKRLSGDLDKGTFEKVTKVLDQCAELIAKGGVFSVSGVSGASGFDGGSPQERLTAIAKSIRSEDPSLTQSKAMILAVERNPEIYLEARKEHLSKPRQ